jgi:hypothetical protein
VSRPIDHGWEALVEVTNANVTQERGALNRALSQIKAAVESLDVTGEELATMIHYQGDLYREVFPTMPLTASALAKWWGKLEAEAQRLRDLAAEKATELEEKRKERRRVTNAHVHNDCVTCGGDGWVVVGQRKPVPSTWAIEKGIKPKEIPPEWGFDEAAPCPVCNLDAPVMRNFWDGRDWQYGPAPGEVVLT